jgi:hypothetical protein
VNDQSRASIGTLVANMAQDVSELVRNEIELAKAEMRESAKRSAAGMGLIAAAVGLLAMAGLIFTFALVYGLATLTGWDLWLCFLLVGLLYLLIAGILGFVASRQLKKVRGPEEAIAANAKTREIVSGLKPGQSAPTPTLSPAPAPPAAAPPSSASSPASSPTGPTAGVAGAASAPAPTPTAGTTSSADH